MRTSLPFFLLLLLFPALSPAWAASPWILRGLILPGEAAERGHYEVGLFPQVGSNGLPVGFPLVQEILPAGRAVFRLRVPTSLVRGYLFAEFVEDGSGHRRWIVPTENPWTPKSRQPAELYLRVDGAAAPLAAPTPPVIDANTQAISGSVETLFTPPGAPIFQGGVVVQVRGRRETTLTDAKGAFVLPLPRFRGQVFLEFRKDGFHPEVRPVAAGELRPLHVALASRAALARIAQHLGLAQGSSLGVLLGRALTEQGTPLAGLSAQLSAKSDGPFYFDEGGMPTRDLRATSNDGRFLFFNVQPGSAFLETEFGGEAVVPMRIATAEGGELVQKEILPVNATLSGRVFQAVKAGGPAPLVGARVRIEGSTEWTTSDSLGAFRLGPFKWSRGERVSVIFSAGNFQNHRYELVPGPAEHRLYAFPARYLDQLAQSQELNVDPVNGIVVGRAPGTRMRVDGLSDQVGPNPARDFYFDARGRMRPSPAMTDPHFGTYMIFNLPAGHAYLLGSDADGTLRYGDELYAGPSVVSVEVDEDR